MNRISARVTSIESVESVSIVAFEAAGQPMRMMSLELDGTLAPGAAVTLGVKASSIALAKAFDGELSISNRLKMTVESMTEGQLLCSVKLRFGGALLESVITRESAQRLHLRVGDTVTALIKASDVSILETLR